MLNSVLFRYLIFISFLLRPQIGLTPGLYLTSPTEGSQLQGVVEIIGSVPEEDFDYADVSFGYGDNAGNNWFIIQKLDNPIHDVVLAQWDTTTITDGKYQLKLTVHRTNGSTADVILENLQVRNYSSIGAVQNQVEPTQNQAAVTSTVSNYSIVGGKDPTTLAPNPVGVGKNEFSIVLISSAVIGALLLILTGIYTFFRSISKR
jgi:hypothetical protein